MIRSFRPKITKTGSAFTLIELLVVVAIVAILASILYPSVVAAKASAQSTKCQSNLRQCVQGLNLYIQDYNYTLPHISFLTWASPQHHIYHKYFKNDFVNVCIPGKQAYGSVETLLSPPSTQHYYPNHARWCKMHVHYGIGVAGTGRGIGRQISTVRYPGRTPAFLCTKIIGKSENSRGYGWGADDGVDPVRQLNLHKGGANYAFVDGHVRWYMPHGGGFQVPIVGLDYDGDGSLGDEETMR